MRGNAGKYLNAIGKASGNANVIDLPAMGIRGDTRMFMMDKNADRIAVMAADWSKKRTPAT